MDQQMLRRAMRYLGYLGFFLAIFFASFLWGFPIERYERAVELQLGKFLNRDVKVGSMELSLTGDLVLYDVEIGLSRKRAAGSPSLLQPAAALDGKTGDKERGRTVLAYNVDRVAIDVGLFAWLFDELDIEVDADALGGTIAFEYSGPFGDSGEAETAARTARNRATPAKDERGAGGKAEEKPLRLYVALRDISLKQLIDLRDLLPVPVSGTLSLEVEIASDTGRFADSDGKASFSLSSLEFSRKGHEAEFFSLRIAVPPLLIEKISGEFAIAKGACELGAFEFKSKDIEAKLEGGITLKDPMGSSVFDLYIMFKILDGYMAKSDTLKAVMPDIGTLSLDMRRAERGDGFWGFRYQGPFGFARFTPAKTFARPRDKARTGRAQQIDRTRKSRFRRRPSFPREEVITPSGGEPTHAMPPPAPAAPGPGGESPGDRFASPAQGFRPMEPAKQESPPPEEEQPADTAGQEEPAEKEEAVEKGGEEEKAPEEGEEKAEGEGKGEDQNGEKGGSEEEEKGKEQPEEGSGAQE